MQKLTIYSKRQAKSYQNRCPKERKINMLNDIINNIAATGKQGKIVSLIPTKDITIGEIADNHAYIEELSVQGENCLITLNAGCIKASTKQEYLLEICPMFGD